MSHNESGHQSVSRTISVKTRITGYVLVTLFAALVGGISAASIVAARSMQRTAEERLRSAATDLGGRVDCWLDSIRAMIQTAAGTPDLLSMDPVRQKPVTQQIQRVYPEMYLVMTMDTKGKNVARNDDVKPKDYGDRVYVRNPLRGVPFSMQSLIGKTSGKPAVAFGTPIRRPGEAPLGVFAVVSETTTIASTIGAARIGQTGLAYLVDQDNQVIAHPETRFTHQLAKFTNDKPVAFLRSNHAGILRYITERDPRTGAQIAPTEYVAYSSQLAGGWGIVVTQQVQEAFAEVRTFVRVATVAVLLALLALGALIWRIISRALRPVEQLMHASARLAAGHLAERVEILKMDEIGKLGVAFNTMAAAIEENIRRLAEHQEKLEETVQLRTAELSTKNQEMRLVLDTVDQGLAVVELAGTIGSERSARFSEWFGVAVEHERVANVLGHRDAKFVAMMHLGWEALGEGLLPLELCLEQLPKRLTSEGRHLELAYRPILNDREELTSVLLIVTDISAELARQKTERDQREVLAVFERVMRDRSGFIEFFNDGAAMVSRFSSPGAVDSAAILRDVHTLKGNSAIMGVASVADACHQLEQQVAEEGTQHLLAELEKLVSVWQAFSERVVPLIGTEPEMTLDVCLDDLRQLSREVLAGSPPTRIIGLIERLQLERVEVRLERAAEHAVALARRIGKEPPLCVVRGNNVRLPHEIWPEFWASFVHLIRNSIDHGLESRDERVSCGKSPQGAITLSAQEQDGHCVIEIADDGRGIDFDKLRALASSRDLPARNEAELIDVLFADGVTTKDIATTTSGRGVGLSAVRRACHTYGGAVEVKSTKGKGTVFRFSFPSPAKHTVSLRPSLRPLLSASFDGKAKA